LASTCCELWLVILAWRFVCCFLEGGGRFEVEAEAFVTAATRCPVEA